MRDTSVSWMQSAGGGVASARDIDRWMRAVFWWEVRSGEAAKEWMSLISTKTGEPIETVSPDDLGGFALGLAMQILGPLGAQWFYEGSSLGYRTLYVWIAVGSDDHCPDQL
ncbi:MAG: hypothetical protein ABWZ01_01800, partial [Methyloceanibacter sp.]